MLLRFEFSNRMHAHLWIGFQAPSFAFYQFVLLLNHECIDIKATVYLALYVVFFYSFRNGIKYHVTFLLLLLLYELKWKKRNPAFWFWLSDETKKTTKFCPCEFLTADWMKNNFVENHEQQHEHSILFVIYLNNEYSNELNYYHFCWRYFNNDYDMKLISPYQWMNAESVNGWNC